MRHARAVLRRGAESDVKHLVFILIGQKGDPRPAFFMLQQITQGIQIPDLPFLKNPIARQFFQLHVLPPSGLF